MNQSDKALKRRLRGLKKLKEALDILHWAAYAAPSDNGESGYIIGTSLFVTAVDEAINNRMEEELKVEEATDAAKEFLENQKEKENAKTPKQTDPPKKTKEKARKAKKTTAQDSSGK